MQGLARRLDRLSQRLERYVSVPLRLFAWRHGRTPLPAAQRWTAPSALGLSADGMVRLEADIAAAAGKTIVVAEVDQDGFLVPDYGPIPHRTCVQRDDFIQRVRIGVRVIAGPRGIAVEKSFRGNRVGFVRELRCLLALRAAGCRVPELFDADLQTLTLRTAFVPGGVLRDLLASRGAKLLDRHTGTVSGHGAERERLRRAREGQRFLAAVAGPRFRDDLLDQLRLAHAAGIALVDVKFGNVILDAADGRPWLIDFELSRWFLLRANPLFAKLRAEDLLRVAEMCDPPGPATGVDLLEVATVVD